MPKPANLIPSKQLNVALPLPLFTQLTLDLHSDLEQRVPHGAYSRFFSQLLREHYEHAELDLAEYVPQLPADLYVVRGDPETIRALRGMFK